MKYNSLKKQLDHAFQRAAIGKGKTRHADDEPFEKQPLCRELRLLGFMPALYQIRKKAQEIAKAIIGEDYTDAIPWILKELEDIIVYAAAARLIVEEYHEGIEKTSKSDM